MRSIQFLCLAFLVSLFIGCSDRAQAPRTGHNVSGTVTFADGTPLNAGMVTISSRGFSAEASIMSGGGYSFGVRIPSGTHQIAVEVQDNPLAGTRADMIDPRFNNPATSGLNVEVRGNTVHAIIVEPPN